MLCSINPKPIACSNHLLGNSDKISFAAFPQRHSRSMHDHSFGGNIYQLAEKAVSKSLPAGSKQADICFWTAVWGKAGGFHAALEESCGLHRCYNVRCKERSSQSLVPRPHQNLWARLAGEHSKWFFKQMHTLTLHTFLFIGHLQKCIQSGMHL